MSPNSDAPDGRQPEEIDLGVPARELGQLEQEPTTDFVPIVRRKIYRRTAASQFVNFAWNVPGVVLRELLMMTVELFKGTRMRSGEKENS